MSHLCNRCQRGREEMQWCSWNQKITVSFYNVAKHNSFCLNFSLNSFINCFFKSPYFESLKVNYFSPWYSPQRTKQMIYGLSILGFAFNLIFTNTFIMQSCKQSPGRFISQFTWLKAGCFSPGEALPCPHQFYQYSCINEWAHMPITRKSTIQWQP